MSRSDDAHATHFTVKGATVSARARRAIVRRVKDEMAGKAVAEERATYQDKPHKLTRDRTASGSGGIGFWRPKPA